MARNGQRNGKQDITAVLIREHRMVVAVLTRIETACEEEEFDEIAEPFAILKTKLTAHAKGEEQAVYPRFAELSDEIKDLIGEAKEEHSLVEDKLEELARIDVKDEEWKAKFTVLKELVEHHVEDRRVGVSEAVGLKGDAASDWPSSTSRQRKIAGPEAERSPVRDRVPDQGRASQKALEMGFEGTASMTKKTSSIPRGARLTWGSRRPVPKRTKA